MPANGASEDRLALERRRAGLALLLKETDPSDGELQRAIEDADTELERMKPKQKRSSFVTADILGRTMELAGISIRDFLTRAFASRDARLDAIEARLDEWKALAERLNEWKDCAVWDSAVEYRTNNHVSHDGSSWVCVADHRGCEPGVNSGGYWRLSVKRGRNGRNANSR